MLIGNYIKKINPKFKDHYFSGISFNSSTCKKNFIFFAIKGNQINGNKYIKDAIKNGAKIIVSNKKYNTVKNGILYIYSSNVRKLLAEISFAIYNKIPRNLIAVTGTNGKSSMLIFIFKY